MNALTTIKHGLLNNDALLLNSMVEIYKRQTKYEKKNMLTISKNKVGFDRFDAKMLSSFAEFYLEHNYLPFEKVTIARRKMLKYAKQLLKIANKEI
jgi:hypothetical protein